MTAPAAGAPRRFYKTAAVEPDGAAFAVRLDGRPVRSPKGSRLSSPTLALAEAIAAEWNGQGEALDLPGMGLTRLAHTALDLSPDAAAALAGEVARYADADLLCYRADGPAELIAEEAAAWDPWLAWAGRDLGVDLVTVQGVTPRPQPRESLARAHALAAGLEPFALTGLAYATALYGSAVLGFAVQRGALAGEAAYDLSRLDEAFQEQRWGVDEEAAIRTAAGRRDAALVGAWFEGLKG